MGKRIEIDGRYYRMRRGKLVEIPPEWVGKVTHPQTIRKRKTTHSAKIDRRIEQKRERKDTSLMSGWGLDCVPGPTTQPEE